MVSEYADMLQVGARNMQNFPLLRRLAQGQAADAAQARPFGDGEGMAAGRRISAHRRKSATWCCASAASRL